MKSGMKKRIILFGIVLLLFGAIESYSLYQKQKALELRKAREQTTVPTINPKAGEAMIDSDDAAKSGKETLGRQRSRELALPRRVASPAQGKLLLRSPGATSAGCAGFTGRGQVR